MARVAVLIAVELVLLIQLASGQPGTIPDRFSEECRDATDVIFRSCNDDTICSDPCRGYFDDVINACGAISGQLISSNLRVPGNPEGYNELCTRREEDEEAQRNAGGAGVLKGQGIYNLLLLSLIAAVIF